jgi:putative ABC transport system permease protein
MRKPNENEFDAEIRFHLQKLIEEKQAAGLSPDEARRNALLEFGGAEQVKESLRDVHRIAWLENTLANLRSGVRLMRKTPGFSAAVILTLALGIGANSAVFSAINAILLRALPFPDGDQLQVLSQIDPKSKRPEGPVAPVRIEDWNRLNSSFQAITGWYTEDVSETSGALPERLTQALVAPRFLRVFGVFPLIGRDFTKEESHFGGPEAVLIGERLWRRRFGADPNITGKKLRFGRSASVIVGVMPASFRFPAREVDLWSPVPADAPYAQSREATWYTAVGRLKPGVPLTRAAADLANVQSRLGRQFPKTDAAIQVGVRPLKETTIGSVRDSLWLLYGSVSLLLVLACTNIAALLLARTVEREREIAVRFALGASRAAVVGRLLAESLVLALAGAMLGLGFAYAGMAGIRSLAVSLPRVEEISLDWRVVLYTLLCGAATTLIWGLFPALRATRNTIGTGLALGGRSQVSARNPLQWFLAGVQISLAVTLLFGAGLLLRSIEELSRVAPGFDASHVLAFRISAGWGETTDYKRLTARIDRTLHELRTMPGIQSAATALSLPGIDLGFRPEVRFAENAAQPVTAVSRVVSPGYFDTLRIPLSEGETCRETPDFHAVVNRSFARKYLTQGRAPGLHLATTGQTKFPPSELRGVVEDARENGIGQPAEPTIYWCGSTPNPSPWFLVRTKGNPLRFANAIRATIHRLEPVRSVYDLGPLEDRVSETFAENRLRTILMSLFAATALSLACIGIYGTLSYFVSARRKEVGLRLALGASRPQVVSRFLVRGLALSVVGCAAGLGLGAGLSRALQSMLYNVTPADPRNILGVFVLVLVVATAAALIPAVRAAMLDPAKVLREE